MSVSVKHLNADSSFLLTFSPDSQPSPTPNSTYTILIDPWLRGDSIVTAPWFAITKRIIPACINHLSEIDEPDVVLVSQNKPDHCHAETLQQLRPDGKTMIVAEPGAAKVIKSWNHFDPARVLALPRFDPQKKFSYASFYIPPLSTGGHRGVVTISFIPAKNYVTGLHQGMGITYLAPTHTKSYASVPTIDLQKKTYSFHLPTSPPLHPTPRRPLTASTMSHQEQERPLTAGARPRLSQNFSLPLQKRPQSPPVPLPRMPYTPPPIFSREEEDSPTSTISSYSCASISTDTNSAATSPTIQTVPNAFTFPKFQFQPLPTPPQSPDSRPFSPIKQSQTPSISSSRTSISRPSPPFTTTSNITAGRPRPLSIIYSPHGIRFTPDLQPYITHHLVPRGALPLTILFHSFSRSTNPWYFGGNITAGVPGGVEIARGLMARVWISAHDEEKNDQGLSVKRLRKEGMRVEEVRRRCFVDEDGGLGAGGWSCDVRSLGAGESMSVGQERDLCVGMGVEGKNRESRLLKVGTAQGVGLGLGEPVEESVDDEESELGGFGFGETVNGAWMEVRT